jgi:hypothetical protein
MSRCALGFRPALGLVVAAYLALAVSSALADEQRGTPAMSTRLTSPELRALLDSHMVRHLAGRHLADGDLLFVASIMGRNAAHDGTVAIRLRSSGELRWARTLEEPKRVGQEPQMPSPWSRENKDDRSRIVPTPDGGALVVGRRDRGYSPAAVKLDEAGKVAWSAVADLGFEGDFDHVPKWVVDAEHAAVLLRGTKVHAGSSPTGPPYGFATFDALTGAKLASGGIGELRCRADVATFMPDGRILYAEACGGGRLRLTTFDRRGQQLEHTELSEMGWSPLAEFDRVYVLAAPPLDLRDGGVLLTGDSNHLIRLDSNLHLTTHVEGGSADQKYDHQQFHETPAGNLLAESLARGGSLRRLSADGTLYEKFSGWHEDGVQALDSWIEADGMKGLAKDGRILNLALSRDPKNPVVSLRPSLTRAHREGSVVTVPLGIGSGRPLPVSVAGTKGPLDSKTYEWATAVELGRLLRETTPGAWRSPETDACSMPAYTTDGGHVVAIVGRASNRVHGPRKYLLDVDSRARQVTWMALDNWIATAEQRDGVLDWTLANQAAEGMVLRARLATQTVEVAFLDLGLHAAGGFNVQVGSIYEIARPVLVLPDGSVVLALNDRTALDVRLERWRKDGTLLWRRDHAGRGPVVSLRLRADGGIALAGPDGFWVAGGDDGALVGERQVRLENLGVLSWTLAPDGVVTAGRHELVRYPLHGEPTRIVLQPALEERQSAWQSADLATPTQLATLDDGSIVLGDVQSTSHEVKGLHGPDETCVARLRRFDAQGRLLWSQLAGESKTWNEWFWHDSGGSQDPVGIGVFGIVRTRFEGCTHMDGLTVLPTGAVVATLIGNTTGLWEIGPDGRMAWLRREPHLWLTRPNVPFGLADGKFGVTTKGPRFGLFDASGKNGGWTGVQEKVAASGLPYAGATTIAGGRIALVRVLD